MAIEKLSTDELKEIQELYGKNLESLDTESFDKLHKELRLKYHPDKFEKFDDEIVREMANEKFKRIEALGEKIKAYLITGANKAPRLSDHEFGPEAQFAYDDMKIEILTREKDLKYVLFGKSLRWLERGESFKIPDTQASLIIDNDYKGSSIGFVETVRLYLSFGPEDSLEEISTWLYSRVSAYASALIIEGQRIPPDLFQMISLIRRKSLLQLGE
ncbi:MAG: hypothetical protein R8P61_23545 [Bacteroidia bacterium]|nr:hypothetical protein [Bacteroidia bacterium]